MERHAGIGYELVFALDALVLHMVDNTVDVLKIFDTMLLVVEHVIEVPKIILQDSIPQRTALGGYRSLVSRPSHVERDEM